MQYYFAAVPSGDPILGDLAMMVANPYAKHTLISNIFNTLVEVVKREAIPKDDEALKYMTWLLDLGLGAATIIQQQTFHTPKPEKEILQNFYPLLAFRILDDEQRGPSSNAEYEPLDQILPLISKYGVAKEVILYYILTRVAARDTNGVRGLLDTLESAGIVVHSEMAFVQTLVTQTVATRELRLANVVIEYLMQRKSYSVFLHKQIVRYLLECHARMHTKELATHIQRLLHPTPAVCSLLLLYLCCLLSHLF